MLRKYGIWMALAGLAALALGVVASAHGERINALWLVTAAICIYLIAYRIYGRFIARRVVAIDPARQTPAHSRGDGLDYVPTHRYVLFGHHFAAIAGAGPLVGPVLGAQLGYLPGFLWIVVGAVLAGAVQDFVILVFSMRRDGRSLGELIREELGAAAGFVAQITIFGIMIIILAVLALIVVKALAHSPWGCATITATIPIAVMMGIYTRYVRPGRVGEVSVAGFLLLLLAVAGGSIVAESPTIAPLFTLSEVQLCWALIGYGAVASILPVWLLLAPRDYLSTFVKIGAIALLAVGVLIVRPMLKMPPLTPFVDGSGPVWAGSLFPFLFVTIACGAVSGFHALIASGTTPKLIDSENDALFIGFGAMLLESFVAVMALVAACVLDPGLYFVMNSPAAVVGSSAGSAAHAVTAMGFPIAPGAITAMAAAMGETTIVSRAGGAPTLAVGMASIFSRVAGGSRLMGFWYHFAILFEALFILTAIDAGTRTGRFMLQDLIGNVVPKFRETSALLPNLVATGLCVSAWGHFLYQGATDPLGGVNTLWPLFALSNQMLAGVALMLATVVMFRAKRQAYAWVVLLPAVWILVCTVTAALLKLFSPDPAIGFLAQGRKFAAGLSQETVIAPAKDIASMSRIIANDRIDAALCAFFIVSTLTILAFSIRSTFRARRPSASASMLPGEPTC